MSEEKKIKKWQVYFLIVLALSFAGLKLWQYHWPTLDISFKDKKLHVLLANNYYRKYKGLGGRESLKNADGMLFVFNEYAQHGIVMRDMKFPIDIVWLNGDQVIDFAQNVPVEPEVKESNLMIYYPRDKGNLVLELPAGWILANNVQIGDKLAIYNE